MLHAFLLFVFVEGSLVSNDMYFYDIERCNYFASRISREYGSRGYYRSSKITAYCLPRLVSEDIKIYH